LPQFCNNIVTIVVYNKNKDLNNLRSTHTQVFTFYSTWLAPGAYFLSDDYPP
jgi:hypothetical protein